jgi:hypothetical protein
LPDLLQDYLEQAKEFVVKRKAIPELPRGINQGSI